MASGLNICGFGKHFGRFYLTNEQLVVQEIHYAYTDKYVVEILAKCD